MVELFPLETGACRLLLEEMSRRGATIRPPVALCTSGVHLSESSSRWARRLISCLAVSCLAAGLGGATASPLSLEAPHATTPEAAAFPAFLAAEVDELGLARQRQRRDFVKRSIYLDEYSSVTSVEIKQFLEKQGSPMAPHADEIVLAGNRYGIDPRMIVAIAGVESQYGKRCRGFNAWGWDGGRKQWSSWSESIDRFSASMRTNYPNWRNIPVVAPRYNPNTPEAWGRKVAYLMEAIQAPA